MQGEGKGGKFIIRLFACHIRQMILFRFGRIPYFGKIIKSYFYQAW